MALQAVARAAHPCSPAAPQGFVCVQIEVYPRFQYVVLLRGWLRLGKG